MENLGNIQTSKALFNTVYERQTKNKGAFRGYHGASKSCCRYLWTHRSSNWFHLNNHDEYKIDWQQRSVHFRDMCCVLLAFLILPFSPGAVFSADALSEELIDVDELKSCEYLVILSSCHNFTKWSRYLTLPRCQQYYHLCYDNDEGHIGVKYYFSEVNHDVLVSVTTAEIAMLNSRASILSRSFKN